jgi:hypothetical protein
LGDWPGLKLDPRNYLARPFKGASPLPARAVSLKYYDEYLKRLSQITGATLIRTDQVFCPDERCLVMTEENLPLYSDTHHLSRAGSDFLTKNVLNDYFR